METVRISGKKTQISSSKIPSVLRKLHSFLPDELFEKIGFMRKKISFIGIIGPKQKIPVFSRNIFSAVLSEYQVSFSEQRLRIHFLVSKNISYCCPIKQFWDLRRNTFCSAVNTSFYVSERKPCRFFSKQINSNVFCFGI